MNIKLVEATKENLKIVKNLVPFYIYDLAVEQEFPPTKEGVYDGCDDMANNWTAKDYYSFIIYLEEYPIGFASVKEIDENSYDIVEFFISRVYQRKGIGKYVSFKLFDKFKGDWQVRELVKNKSAQNFWRKIIKEYTKGNYQEAPEMYECKYSGKWEMVVQRFVSK